MDINCYIFRIFFDARFKFSISFINNLLSTHRARIVSRVNPVKHALIVKQMFTTQIYELFIVLSKVLKANTALGVVVALRIAVLEVYLVCRIV